MNAPATLIATLNTLVNTLDEAKARQREANRRYYHRNVAQRAEYHKAWYEANKARLREHYRIKAQERRAAVRAANNQNEQ